MFTDSSSSVREAAVDLLSRFLFHQPNLAEKYYTMISNRILVRKVVVVCLVVVLYSVLFCVEGLLNFNFHF